MNIRVVAIEGTPSLIQPRVLFWSSVPYAPWDGAHEFDEDETSSSPGDFCYRHQAFCLDSTGPYQWCVLL